MFLKSVDMGSRPIRIAASAALPAVTQNVVMEKRSNLSINVMSLYHCGILKEGGRSSD